MQSKPMPAAIVVLASLIRGARNKLLAFQQLPHGDLLVRLITGCSLGFITYITLWHIPKLFELFMWLLAAAALREWLRMMLGDTWRQHKIPTYGALAIVAFITIMLGYKWGAMSLAVVTLAIAIYGFDQKVKNPVALAAGYPYLIISVLSVLWLADVPYWGPNAITFLLLIVIFTDVGAYFFGRALGGPKLWQAVSPKKTWSGFLGGLVFAAFTAWVFASIIDTEHPFITVSLGILISVIGQLGDLLESAIKRYYHVKDTGTALPGHGGILDRIDSLLLATPVYLLVMLWLEPKLPW